MQKPAGIHRDERQGQKPRIHDRRASVPQARGCSAAGSPQSVDLRTHTQKTSYCHIVWLRFTTPLLYLIVRFFHRILTANCSILLSQFPHLMLHYYYFCIYYDSGSQTFSTGGSLAKSRFSQGSECQILRSALCDIETADDFLQGLLGKINCNVTNSKYC